MAFSTAKLDKHLFRVIPTEISSFEAYGCWDSLIAVNKDGSVFDWTPAHDGDFYPESPSDYIEAIRIQITEKQALPHPIRIDIDISQSCPSDCTFCFSREYRKQRDYKGAWINERELRKILSQSAKLGTTSIRYCGGGDPLAHPEIKSLLQIPKEYGQKLTVLTSGDLLNAEIADLMVSHVDHLRWSINASQEETRKIIHRSSRNSNTLDKMKHRIRIIADNSNALPTNMRTMIWGTFLLIPENVFEIEEAILLARETKINSLSFRPVFHGLIKNGHKKRKEH